ncbi:aldehyde dehydrogenase [Gregarina niphandrodes]|uniref:Aldehyde dehydrogenase n=1 Tax=Gregarina niphandrodes TaxID=110365 RepID=A0A023B9T1_GRENI|nr:aldehyde dehydrogenase [Gregarina niphandrodes]EZG73416.1 aldehyde dehydrogenase [Gregarina niphandrodes]|eukprot:XP_011129654.1 aldehyde dehydrogenase [Gregarina niphandrodes]
MALSAAAPSDLLKKGLKRYPETLAKEEIGVSSSCLYSEVEAAVEACVAAQTAFAIQPWSVRRSIVNEIREVCGELAEDFALWAYSETGRGDYMDKVVKQRLSAEKTPGPEDLGCKSMTGDEGLTLIEYAPYGVIGAVTPVTNPTATIIHNTICMVSSGNGIVFNAHPAAVCCTNRVVAVVNEIVKKNGGPDSLVCAIAEPTIETGQLLLNHPKTAANLVTGGPAVVKAALKSGKKCFCAGPGNPPVVVDETADLKEAAKAIVEGASFDNNMICSDEKEVFVVNQVYDQLLEQFRKAGAYIATSEEIKTLEKAVLKEHPGTFTHGQVNVPFVGQSAKYILSTVLGKEEAKDAEAKDAEDRTRLIIAPVEDGHPFVYTELLMPILPVVSVPSFEEAVACAVKAEHGYRHTASIYSTDVQRITRMGRTVNTSIFCVNGNHLTGLAAGGEGYTSFSITGYTGEGMTRPRTFVRERRIVFVGSLNFS